MKKLLLLCVLLFSFITNAQLNVNNTLYSPADLILTKLIGPGLAVSNVKYNNSSANAFVTNNQLGFYSTGATATNLGLSSGLIMTNGSATGAIGPNNAAGSTTVSNSPMNGDPDLGQITTLSINNICILEFDFVPLGPEVKFEYVFASEEYPEYVGSQFNDVFGFFLSGPGITGPYSNNAKNIALIPNTNIPITINNVNAGSNSSYYVSNAGGAHIQYDAFTTVLTARSEVQCGQTYHIKLAIADVGDSAFDSAVFFKEKSFSVPLVNLGGDMTGPSKACCGEILPFSTPFNPTDYPGAIHNWYFNNTLVYTSATSNIFQFDNLTCTNGTLKVIVQPYPGQNCTFEDEIIIEYQYGPPLNTPPPLTLCSDNPATATGVFDLNMQINNIIPGFNSDYEELGFFLTKADAMSNNNGIPPASWHTYNGSENQSIFLGVSNVMLTGNYCRSVMEFKLKFVNCDYIICSPTPSTALFDLTTRKPIIFNGFDPTKYSITFHHDMPSAIAGTGAITPENAYVSMSNPEEIYVRYWENAVPLNKQFTQFTLLASQSNYAGTDGTLTFCKDDTDVFNLADFIGGEQSGGTWSIVSGSGATIDLVAGTITSSNTSGSYVLQYLVNASSTCPADTSTLNVTINAVCGVQTPPNMVLCDDSSNNGVEIFDLTLQNAAILGTLNSADYTISYHTSSANAVSGAAPITPMNAYPNISNPQTIYIRVIKNVDGSVFDTSKFFDLIVVAPPTVTSFTGTTAICNGSSTNLVFVGTPNASVTYSDGTTNSSVTLDGSGNATVSVSPTVMTTYTLVGVATVGPPVCSNSATGSVVITVNNTPIAGTDNNTTVCETSVAVIDLYSLINGEQAGGTWVRSTGTGGTFNAAAGTFTPAIGATTSTFTYTLTASAPCLDDSSVATVNINPQPIAGTGGATLVCETSTVAIDLFSLITGEQAGGTWTRTLGAGGTFDAVAGTFTPAVGTSAISEFTYTLVGTSPCVNASSVATINVNPQPVAGTDGNTTVCETSTVAIDLFSLITGEQAGGTWVRSTGTGGTFNAAAGTFTPALGASAISTFTYTLVGTAPCVNASSVATVNVNPQPIAGTDGATLVCETSTAVIDLFSLITGEQAGGVWTRTGGTGGTFDAAAGTFIPAVGATTSAFTYTLTGTAPCIDDTSVATVNINPQPVAGTDGAITVCETSVTAIDLFSLITGEQAGGTWARLTGTGGTFNAAAGTFTPAVGASAISTFEYTLVGVAPCVNDFSVATINVTPQPIAGTDGNTTICDNSVTTIDLYSLITGEQAGGAWTRTSGTGGTFNAAAGTFTPALGATTSNFTYTLTATAPCINDSSVATVNINPIPTVAITGTTGTCAGIPVNLAVTGTPGATITWTGTPSSFVIPSSGMYPIQVSPATTTTYTLLTATNGCTIAVAGQSATVTVSATPQFVTQIPDATICDGQTLNIASQLTSTEPGTTYVWWVSTNNINLPLVSGDQTDIDQVVDLINALENGTITIAVKPRIGNCFGNEQQIVITIKPIPVINSVTAVRTTLCNGETAEIDVDADPVGTTFTWQINTATNVLIAGGATSGTSTTGNIDLQLSLIDPLVAGSISFDVTPINGICTGTTATNSVTINVNPIPGSPIGLLQDEVCSEETINLTISASPNIAGTELEWVVLESQNVTGATSGSGLAPIQIQDVLVNTSDVQGYVKYRVQTVLGDCQGGFTDYIIYVNPLPKPVLLDGHICVNQATGNTYQSYILNTQLNNPNYTYDWFVYNTATSTFDPIASATGSTYEVTTAGEYQVIVTNQVTGCIGESTATVIEVFPATGFTYTVTEAFTNNATITINVSPMGTGSLIYSIDGGAWQTSNVFEGVEAGTHEILVSDEEGCTNLSEEVLVVDYMKYFTPNGDGFNDTWNIVGLNAQHNAKIYIFDRYGKLIKQIDPLGQGWDGKYNGQDIPSTDYWFSVDYTENEQQKQFKAHFTLKR